MKQYLTSLAVLCLIVVLPARAEQDPKTAKVEELMQLMNLQQLVEDSMELMMGQMNSGMLQQLLGMELPDEQEKLVARFQDKIGRYITDALAWENLKADYVKLYADTFSEQELDEILAFYRSPAGQAMVSRSPVLMAKASRVAERRLTALMPEMQAMFKELMREER